MIGHDAVGVVEMQNAVGLWCIFVDGAVYLDHFVFRYVEGQADGAVLSLAEGSIKGVGIDIIVVNGRILIARCGVAATVNEVEIGSLPSVFSTVEDNLSGLWSQLAIVFPQPDIVAILVLADDGAGLSGPIASGIIILVAVPRPAIDRRQWCRCFEVGVGTILTC